MHNKQLPRWDLSDLYKDIEDPKIEVDLASALESAAGFEKQYRTCIKSGKLTPEALEKAIRELETIRELEDRLLSYATLVFSADTKNPKHGALLQRLRERSTAIGLHLLFFELEWAAIPKEQAKVLLKDAVLSKDRHFLESIRRFSAHQLSEPEEKILEEKANTGIRAFQRLFDETISNIQFSVSVDGLSKEMSEQECLSLIHDERREVRQEAAKGLTGGLQKNARILSFILNQITADHAGDDRLRRFSEPISSRHLSNEIDPRAVEALLSSCERYYPIVRRYYRLKKKRLGLEKLYDYDRYAPMASSKTDPIPFDKAKTLVLAAFRDFSEEAESIAAIFFEKNWIDAAVRPGKQGGAYSHGVVPSAHPYVFLNYLGTPRDVMTLAHELGHGIHQSLSKSQNYFNFSTPLTTAETASVFSEMLLFHRMQQGESDPERRLDLMMKKLEEDFATVFRQVSLCRFEQSVHRARRDEGELSLDRIGQLWLKANRTMFEDSVHLTDDYRYWWAYIPHFIHAPFYTYAYPFGHLLVLALYKKYLREGRVFVPKYLNLLRAGGSESPDRLLKETMNIDFTKDDFWCEGLDLLEAMVTEAEEIDASL